MRKHLVLMVLAAILALTVLGCSTMSTISGSVKTRLPPPEEVEGGILFRYDSPAARMVTLAGNFNNWGGTQGGGRYDPTIDPMSDDDGDGVWTIVMPLPPGRYQYKFVIDNAVRWELDPSNPNTGFEGGIENSLIIVPENIAYVPTIVTGTVLPGQLTRKAAGAKDAKPVEVTVELDAPFAKKVYISGEFNDWAADADAMTKGDDGIWRITLSLAPGQYEYKFVVDGTWMEDPDNPESVADPFGGNNSLLTVE
ncbi:MAG: glycogen-binding domain-containing protein [bacterium]|jgi:1,4-alpha-glucan branching enzyme